MKHTNKSINHKVGNKKEKNKNLAKGLYISIAIVTVLVNVMAWSSTAFCDAYIAYIFPIWVNTYGRITGIFPFSVGEWLLVAGVVLVGIAVLLGILQICKSFLEHNKSIVNVLDKYTKKYYCFLIWILLIVCVIMTLNCSILYHASTFSKKYFGEDMGEYTLEQCIQVYNYVAEACNHLSEQMQRDTEGKIIYPVVSGLKEDTTDTITDNEILEEIMDADSVKNHMADTAIQSMQNLGKKYPQLDGWYPRPKPMAFSDFMCQQYMCGYYFPFSMEANYNDVMYIMNKPATMCHELAHLRGYIFEDEANFISFLACVESEDIVFQYAGYLSVITYLENDLYYAKQGEPQLFEKAAEQIAPIAILPQVREDNIFVEQHEWDRINQKAIWDKETVDKMSDAFTDTTLKLNGVSDGMVSYSRVVRLLLHYYASMDII